MASHCGLDDPKRQSRAGALAEPQAEIEQGVLPQPPQHVPVRGLRRNMAGNAMVDRRAVQGPQNCSGGADDITVEDDRDALDPGGHDGPGDGGDFAAAETPHHL